MRRTRNYWKMIGLNYSLAYSIWWQTQYIASYKKNKGGCVRDGSILLSFSLSLSVKCVRNSLKSRLHFLSQRRNVYFLSLRSTFAFYVYDYAWVFLLPPHLFFWVVVEWGSMCGTAKPSYVAWVLHHKIIVCICTLLLNFQINTGSSN